MIYRWQIYLAVPFELSLLPVHSIPLLTSSHMDNSSYKQEQPLIEPYANIIENKSSEMQKSLLGKQ